MPIPGTVQPYYPHEVAVDLPFATVALYAGKPLCPADALGRPCQCIRCVAILVSRQISELRRRIAA